MGIAFSPAGTQVATGGEDGTVRLFGVRVEDLAALARSRLTRPLITEECLKYVHAEASRCAPTAAVIERRQELFQPAPAR